jgi:hypothetical protein
MAISEITRAKRLLSLQIEKAMLNATDLLIAKADIYVPVDTSALRDTARSEITQNDKNAVEVTITYGDQDVEYSGVHYFSKLRHLFSSGKPVSIRTSRFAKAGGKKTGLATGDEAKYGRAYYAARKADALTKKALPWLQLALDNVSTLKENMIRVFVNTFRR